MRCDLFSNSSSSSDATLLCDWQSYVAGFSIIWTVIGCACGTFFNWTALAKRFRKLTGFFRAITIPDYLESRFEDGSHVLRVVSALLAKPEHRRAQRDDVRVRKG